MATNIDTDKFKKSDGTYDYNAIFNDVKARTLAHYSGNNATSGNCQEFCKYNGLLTNNKRVYAGDCYGVVLKIENNNDLSFVMDINPSKRWSNAKNN